METGSFSLDASKCPRTTMTSGGKITRFANTQNEVSGQDFTFLDDEQHRLRRELSVIGYEYLIRSAEQPRSTDPSKVIDVRQAAVSLACASSIAHAVQAKREISRLFTDSSTYSALFNPTTDVLLLARAVEVVRSVDAALDDIEKASEGARSGVAVHGRRIVAYCILNDIGSAPSARSRDRFRYPTCVGARKGRSDRRSDR